MSYIMQRVRHRRGYGPYARNDQTPKHKAVAFRQDRNGELFCICDYPVSVVMYSAVTGKVIR